MKCRHVSLEHSNSLPVSVAGETQADALADCVADDHWPVAVRVEHPSLTSASDSSYLDLAVTNGIAQVASLEEVVKARRWSSIRGMRCGRRPGNDWTNLGIALSGVQTKQHERLSLASKLECWLACQIRVPDYLCTLACPQTPRLQAK